MLPLKPLQRRPMAVLITDQSMPQKHAVNCARWNLDALAVEQYAKLTSTPVWIHPPQSYDPRLKLRRCLQPRAQWSSAPLCDGFDPTCTITHQPLISGRPRDAELLA